MENKINFKELYDQLYQMSLGELNEEIQKGGYYGNELEFVIMINDFILKKKQEKVISKREYNIEQYSVKNTTDEERRSMIETSIGLTNLGGTKPSKTYTDLAEEYIKGNLDISDFLKAVDDSVENKIKDYKEKQGLLI